MGIRMMRELAGWVLATAFEGAAQRGAKRNAWSAMTADASRRRARAEVDAYLAAAAAATGHQAS